jgi:hypothetical protein
VALLASALVFPRHKAQPDLHGRFCMANGATPVSRTHTRAGKDARRGVKSHRVHNAGTVIYGSLPLPLSHGAHDHHEEAGRYRDSDFRFDR